MLTGVNNVLQKQPHMINNTEVRVSRWQPPIPVPTCIEVTGFKPGMTEQHIDMYFSNKKKSGGGRIKLVKMEEARCLVMFESADGECYCLLLKCLVLTRPGYLFFEWERIRLHEFHIGC